MTGDIEEARRAEVKKAAIITNAYQVMNELNKQERKLIKFRLNQTKLIKCKFCDHKG